MLKDFLKPDWNSLSGTRATGNAVAIDNALCLETDHGPLRITAVAPKIFRVQLGAPTDIDYGFVQDTTPLSDVQINSDALTLSTDAATFSLINEDGLALDISYNGKDVISPSGDAHFVRTYRLPPLCVDERRAFCSFDLITGEAVFGLGERWGALNKRARLHRSHAEDALGVNAEVAYKNIPFAWSPRGWGMLVNSPATCWHGIGFPQWSQRSYGLLVDEPRLDLFFIVGDKGEDIIDGYHQLTGYPCDVPDWSLGPWMSRAYYRTAEDALAEAREIRERGMPCDVITLDGRAWLDTPTRFAFEWDATRYPDPKKVTDELHDLGYKVCVWEYPFVSVNHPLHKELDDKGWFLKDKDSGETLVLKWDPSPFGEVLTPLPDSGMFDFTNPDAYAWWRDKHKELFDSGIDIIKSDFGEQIPENAIAFNGDTGSRLHNAYPALYQRCVYEASKDYFGDDAIVFGRSGWIGAQTVPVQWGGDPQADWGGLAASLRASLTYSLSGVPYYATDIGGFYADKRDPELFIRWTQAAVFCSHMRFHGIGERAPWSYGEDIWETVKPWLQLRQDLIPYIRKTLDATPGRRLLTPMVLAEPDRPWAWQFQHQFLFGRDLLVAPVVTQSGDMDVYLPKGDWIDVWSGKSYRGSTVVRQRYGLDQIPLFQRRRSRLKLKFPGQE